jgi:hypothetical protein
MTRYGTFFNAKCVEKWTVMALSLTLLDRFKNHMFYVRKRMKKLALFWRTLKNIFKSSNLQERNLTVVKNGNIYCQLDHDSHNLLDLLIFFDRTVKQIVYNQNIECSFKFLVKVDVKSRLWTHYRLRITCLNLTFLPSGIWRNQSSPLQPRPSFQWFLHTERLENRKIWSLSWITFFQINFPNCKNFMIVAFILRNNRMRLYQFSTRQSSYI